MNTSSSLSKSLLRVAAGCGLLLLVPAIAMQFTEDVQWSASDFLVMGALLFATGSAYVLISRMASHASYRLALGLGIGTTFFMVWSNLAVGLIGSGPHWGNFMYAAVVAIVIIGTILSRFSAQGMERVMYVVSGSLVVLASIALFADMQSYPGSSVGEIIGVNAFFATLYVIAGVLFRYAAQTNTASE